MSIPIGHLLKLSLGRTAYRTLELTLNPLLAGPEVTNGLVDVMNTNQAYYHFMQKIEALAGRGEQWGEGENKDGGVPQIPPTNIVGLLGKSTTRNSLLALRINRLRNEGLTRKEKDSMAMSPREQLHYALYLEEFCQDNYLAFPENAFKAGLHYDWIWSLIDKDKEIPKETKAYFEEVWAEGFAIAQIAYGLGGLVKNLPHQEYVFAAGLLLPIGKIYMSMTMGKDGKTPNWKDYLAEMDKYGHRSTDYQLVTEKTKFGVTHAQYSALCMAVMGLAHPAERAVCFYMEPYFLKWAPKEKTWYPLTVLLHLAAHIRKSQNNKWAVAFSEVQGKMMKELSVKEANIPIILKKVKPYSKK